MKSGGNKSFSSSRVKPKRLGKRAQRAGECQTVRLSHQVGDGFTVIDFVRPAG